MTMISAKTDRNASRYEIEFDADGEWISVAFTDCAHEFSAVNDARFRVHDHMLDRSFRLGAVNGPKNH